MIITRNDLEKIREKFKDKKIVFCSGVYDMPHDGHIQFFENCKELGDILVVCVCCDKNVKIYKGEKRPIYPQESRVKIISSFKPVDFAFLSYEALNTEEVIDFYEAFKLLRPDVYLVSNETKGKEAKERLAKENGCKFIVQSRQETSRGISTSDVIEKIKKNC